MKQFVQNSTRTILVTLVLLVVGVGPFVFLGLLGKSAQDSYCGNVVKAYQDGKNNHVIFYCDSIQRYIHVQVTYGEWLNAQPNHRVCYSLLPSQINK